MTLLQERTQEGHRPKLAAYAERRAEEPLNRRQRDVACYYVRPLGAGRPAAGEAPVK